MELSLKPSHAKVKDYYNALNQFGQLNISHETAVRQAFASLLDDCARKFKWKLVQEFPILLPKNKRIIVDGALLDAFTGEHGYWEAKDLKDDLEKEAKTKLALGYPNDNIIFQSPTRAILYQNGVRQAVNEDITDPKNLVELLKAYFLFSTPQHKEWERAVEEFAPKIPDIAKGAKEILDKERERNKEFATAFNGFVQLCRKAMNPNLSEDAVETMLIQHLLTERIFRKVFDNPEFTRRNIIAIEIEKVISKITDKRFSRDEFLEDLDYLYRAIEDKARATKDYAKKQSFLNTVYERFFQGFSPKQADTHGIVYTPQPIVNFMVRSVEETLKKEFAKSLSDKEVHILDPFVGTGNFIVRVMGEVKTTKLPEKYAKELHCNEVMLLPYYIACMNIEHEYIDKTNEYKPFEGICLVDTFDIKRQASTFTEKNSERIALQQKQQIFVVLGNPPYNAWQESENENNPNRHYDELDQRIAETYAAASRATNKNALSDPYIKAIRWASDRIPAAGIIAFVTNSGFLDSLAADGLRKHLALEFDEIYIVDLGGNVRKNPRLSGTTHNVFGIQVGVSINILVRRDVPREKRVCRIHYCRTDEFWTRQRKYDWLQENDRISKLQWELLTPNESYFWLNSAEESEFGTFTPLAADKGNSLFRVISNGVQTNRDAWVYSFDTELLHKQVLKISKVYNEQIREWKASDQEPELLPSLLQLDESKIKWSSRLKENLLAEKTAVFNMNNVRTALYRPYVKQYLYFDSILVHRRGQFPQIFPTKDSANSIIWLKIGSDWPMFALCADRIADQLPQGGSQCFPFYTYAEDGSNRRENITDWALDQFRSHYKDKSIAKWDIFYYTYAVLHHPEYRTRYAANLKRELPRIPYAPAFPAFVEAGKRLAELHVDYEKQEEYKPLERREKPGEKLNLRVEKMRLSKDKQTLVYNDFLTLTGIPKETYDYRLGNRSALEWVIDQYQISTDKRSGITNDPNRDDDKEYILRLIGQVITVSLETVKIVNALPDLGLPKETGAQATTAKATTTVQ